MSISFPPSRVTELKWALALCGLLAALFVLFPEIDLWASGLFFDRGEWLVPRDSVWLLFPYRIVPRLGQLVIVATLLLLIAACLPRWKMRLARLRPLAIFVLAAALIGPVLLVDKGFKAYSGRARPINVEAFGGEKLFTPAFIPARQCRKNCSFVSGHVANVAFLMAFGWLSAPRRRRQWLLAGGGAALLMAVARMLPGGHFLSDTLFAGFAIYFSLWLTELLLRLTGLLPPSEKKSA